jgi:hypothetical protein
MKTLLTLLLFLVLFNETIAQQELIAPNLFHKRAIQSSISGQKLSKNYTQYKIPGKRASQYTSDDWGSIIDSTWGAGQSANEQYIIFDTFWSVVDQQWAGFPNLSIDWDSMRNVYRPQIGDGLSRGKFYSLMSRMWLELSEFHTWIYDPKVDTTFGFNSVDYRPGVPLLCIGPGLGNMIGAAVTPLADSTNLVYRVTPDNPLGLKPGDLVIGYEGLPWKRLYRQLLDAGLPISRVYSIPGTTSESMTYHFLMAVGCNWGLFDTIDVVKYSSGDTLHMPTALLDTTVQTVWQSDQVPVPGVPMPEGPYSTLAVTWGVIQGTNIGYIYVWDWISNETRLLFQSAITDLLQNQKVAGLVVDFRMNWGGDPSYSYGGFTQLFNFDPTPNLSRAYRNSQINHMSFNFYETIWGSLQANTLYDRPIAILIGPGCLSAGDICALYLSYHPMARLFGKPTNGAFVGDNYTTGTISGDWAYQVPTSILYSNVPDTGFLIHKGLEPDEEVWLTRDGVAKGEDDVVKRALEWINNLSYAHNVSVDRTFIKPNADTVIISAIVENPNQHPITILATLTNDSNAVLDSMNLYDDGLHHDGQTGDKVWANTYVNNSEQTVHVSITTDDPITDDTRHLSNAVQFTSIGPLVFEGIRNTSTDQEINAGDLLSFRFTLRNESETATAINVASNVVPLDTCASKITIAKCAYGNLTAGESHESTNAQQIRFNKNCAGQTARFALDIYSNNYKFWSDTFSIYINPPSGIELGEDVIVKDFKLKQNYPNPFNPTTIIEFALPKTEFITLKVFNVLGQQVATLVSEKLNPGIHKYEWQAGNLPSGIYYCRMEAGKFEQVRKMILLK